MGLLLARRTRAGLRSLVVNVFAGIPAGDPEAARRVSARRAEDHAALTGLGVAEVDNLDLLDAIDRRGADGQALYRAGDALFGLLDQADHDLPVDIAEQLLERPSVIRELEGACVIVPMGVGEHVDHRLVHGAGRLLASLGHPVLAFEDLPYSLQPEAREAALAARGARGWSLELEVAGADELEAKVAALEAYATQREFFDRAGAVAGCRAHALAAGSGRPAERLWRMPGQTASP